MRISLLCVGKLSREYQPVFRHYGRLLGPYADLEVVQVGETPVAQGGDRVRATEGEALLRRVRPSAYTVVLDREGREFSSEELSGFFADLKLYGKSDFQFILGGALGLDPRVSAKADLAWSLSRLTFPHQLARCVLAEQLYRAIRIERGEPYHY
jgi:23S rRNA (pseudouridine1915-N3)-methyltransferase